MTRPVPPGCAADVWWFDTRKISLGPADLAELSDPERQRAAGLVFTADRHRYQAAHVLLRRVLAGYLEAGAAELRFGQEPCPRCGGPGGRPVLAGLPGGAGGAGTGGAEAERAAAGGAPAGAAGADAGDGAAPLWFSLSHSGDAVLIAVAARPVGADTEQDPAGCVCSLSSGMHPADAAAVAGLPEPARHQAVISWWVRAEAALKCSGTGLSHGLGAFPVLPPVASCPGLPGRECLLAAVPSPAGYHAALALAGPGPGPELIMAAAPGGTGAATAGLPDE